MGYARFSVRINQIKLNYHLFPPRNYYTLMGKPLDADISVWGHDFGASLTDAQRAYLAVEYPNAQAGKDYIYVGLCSAFCSRRTNATLAQPVRV